MRRRKVLAGLGSLAAGGAAAMGTGAFTSAQAKRSITVDVTSDPNSYLGLEATGDRASIVDGQLQLDLSKLNPNARTAFHDIFAIRNNGDNPVAVAVGTSQTNVYIDSQADANQFGTPLDGTVDNPKATDPSEKLLNDYGGIDGAFVFGNKGSADPSGGTPQFGSVGLGANGSTKMGIDNGGRVYLYQGPDPERVLGSGEAMWVDFDIITSGAPSDINLASANRGMIVMGVEPNSERQAAASDVDSP